LSYAHYLLYLLSASWYYHSLYGVKSVDCGTPIQVGFVGFLKRPYLNVRYTL